MRNIVRRTAFRTLHLKQEKKKQIAFRLMHTF